jgi:hypothetical protein
MVTSAMVRGHLVLATPLAARLRMLLVRPVLYALVALLLPALGEWLWNLLLGRPLGPPYLGGAETLSGAAVSGSLLFVGVFILGWRSLSRIPTLMLTPDGVCVYRSEGPQTVLRMDIEAVFLDGPLLVVMDRESRQVVRDPIELPASEVAAAFQGYGYPWCSADPYAARYRPWVPGMPELPSLVHAELVQRRRALRMRASLDVRCLQEAVEMLGYTVREVGTKQYWRPLVSR